MVVLLLRRNRWGGVGRNSNEVGACDRQRLKLGRERDLTREDKRENKTQGQE